MSPPLVEANHRRITFRVRPGTNEEKRRQLFDGWYRDQIRAAVPPLLAKWQPMMGVAVNRVFVQRMRTRWGCCNRGTRNIRLNTDLARKPRECLEYILVHEMARLLEPKHGDRFVTWMDRLIPRWRLLRERLNRLPIRHEHWEA